LKIVKGLKAVKKTSKGLLQNLQTFIVFNVVYAFGWLLTPST